MSLLNNLLQTGTDVDDVPQPGGAYIALNVRGSTATVAIQFPIVKKQLLYTGKLGSQLNSEDGYKAARICAINVLKQVNRYLREEDIVGLNHIDIMYQCTEDWDEGPTVANGASDLFLEVLGDKGKHTRSIAGVFRLPKQLCVAVVASFTVKEGAALLNA